ncbi:MAG: hypothetical protein ACYDH1_14570 [Anaerolineaceae bacterium]
MSVSSSQQFLHTFKGARLSCLIALLCNRYPMGSTQLVRYTGYSQKTVCEALTFLSEIQVVVNIGGYKAWLINPQLPHAALPEFLWNFSTNYVIFSPTTTTNNNQDLIEKKEVVAVDSLTPEVTESHALLRIAAIGEPMATALAEKPHITPYYVAAHYAKALADKVPTGLLIHRLRTEDPAPDMNVMYHLLNCTCPTCDSLRFSPDHGYLHPDDFDPQDYLANFTPPKSY